MTHKYNSSSCCPWRSNHQKQINSSPIQDNSQNPFNLAWTFPVSHSTTVAGCSEFVCMYACLLFFSLHFTSTDDKLCELYNYNHKVQGYFSGVVQTIGCQTSSQTLTPGQCWRFNEIFKVRNYRLYTICQHMPQRQTLLFSAFLPSLSSSYYYYYFVSSLFSIE